jgi:hypothetical protein
VFRAAALLFLGIASMLFVFHANHVVATNDEGIVLDAAQRMLSGARPYADFFAYMSPGSYWLQEVVFRIFGVSLWSGRIIVILDFSLQCAMLFWLVARFASRTAAWAVTAMFFGFQIADPSILTAQHRWDSATFALVGLCVAISAKRVAAWMVSGALFGAAAWCTPAMALIGALVAVFLLIRDRRRLIPFIAGIGAVTAAAVVALSASGSFGAFLNQVLWLQRNYSALNFMPYGAIIGGYRALFEDSSGVMEVLMRSALVACVALPAILPVLGLLLSAFIVGPAFVPASRLFSRLEQLARLQNLKPAGKPARRLIGGPTVSDQEWIILLMMIVVALVASTYPRSDVEHLAFVAAVPYALVAIAFSRVIPKRAAGIASTVAIVFACVFAANFFNSWRNTRTIESPIGPLRVATTDADQLAALLARVPPGQAAFVYPYMPIDYILTQAKNPTRFSFLNPGMMTHEDSLKALDALRANPPENVLYLKLSAQELVRVFPNGANLDWHYHELEDWLEQNYAPVEPQIALWGYRLCRRVEQGSASPPAPHPLSETLKTRATRLF